MPPGDDPIGDGAGVLIGKDGFRSIQTVLVRTDFGRDPLEGWVAHRSSLPRTP